MTKTGNFAPFAMFWLLVGALLLAEGKPPLAILAGLVFMTLPYFVANWVQARHRARARAAGKTAASADQASRALGRDIAAGLMAGAACLALALWALLAF